MTAPTNLVSFCPPPDSREPANKRCPAAKVPHSSQIIYLTRWIHFDFSCRLNKVTRTEFILVCRFNVDRWRATGGRSPEEVVSAFGCAGLWQNAKGGAPLQFSLMTRPLSKQQTRHGRWWPFLTWISRVNNTPPHLRNNNIQIAIATNWLDLKVAGPATVLHQLCHVSILQQKTKCPQKCENTWWWAFYWVGRVTIDRLAKSTRHVQSDRQQGTPVGRTLDKRTQFKNISFVTGRLDKVGRKSVFYLVFPHILTAGHHLTPLYPPIDTDWSVFSGVKPWKWARFAASFSPVHENGRENAFSPNLDRHSSEAF